MSLGSFDPPPADSNQFSIKSASNREATLASEYEKLVY